MGEASDILHWCVWVTHLSLTTPAMVSIRGGLLAPVVCGRSPPSGWSLNVADFPSDWSLNVGDARMLDLRSPDAAAQRFPGAGSIVVSASVTSWHSSVGDSSAPAEFAARAAVPTSSVVSVVCSCSGRAPLSAPRPPRTREAGRARNAQRRRRAQWPSTQDRGEEERGEGTSAGEEGTALAAESSKLAGL